MLSVLGFLVILGPLVIVHELGHFLFARLFGVKAEIFSVGFGPTLWKRQKGETEYRLSAIPLGGYVKLFGEEPGVELSEADKKRALQYAAPWKRFFIFFGGPLFNFLFAILVFMAILAIGEPRVSNIVGRVVSGSMAEKAGFQSGDRVLEVQGKPVRLFNDIQMAIHESPGIPMVFKLERPGNSSPVQLTVTPDAEEGFTMYGEIGKVGKIDGLQPMARLPRVGVSHPESLAAKAGFKTGDEIKTLNGAPVATWEELERRVVELAAGSDVVFNIGEREIRLKKTGKANTPGALWGLYSSELFVEKAIDESPAAKAGVQTGDRLASVQGAPIDSFFDLRAAIQKAGEQHGKVTVSWERAGQVMSSEIVPTETRGRDPVLKKTVEYTIGVMPMLYFAQPETVVERIWNPFILLYKGTERMIDFTWRNVVSIGKMFSGSVSVATLGGPILIGKLAGDSLERGLIAFLTTMAILSVGLGILNILPIPVLDGGHLLLLGIEAIRGRPLSIRQTEILQQVGLSLILLLMVVVIRNDLARLPIFN